MRKHVRRIGLTAAVVLSVVAAGCADGAPTAPSAPSAPVNLSGNWSGTYAHTSGSGSATWQITQSGAAITGTMVATTPSPAVVYNGNVSGTLSGTTLTVTVNFPAGGITGSPSCTGSISGTATAGSTTITGTYGGADCFGPFVDGHFNLTKQ